MSGVIQKWLERLDFPAEWQDRIVSAARLTGPGIGREMLDAQPDPLLNLLYVLSQCDQVEEAYQKRGIPQAILLDTLSDILTWTGNYYQDTGLIGLRHIGWLEHHLSFKLFRLGRLQFEFEKAYAANVRGNAAKDDPIVKIHVPQGPSLIRTECQASYAQARQFFASYFPEYAYNYFTLRSWLLDFNLLNWLKASANIVEFQKDYAITHYEENYGALLFVFGRNATLENVNDFPAQTTLQQKIIAHLNQGGKLYTGLGWIKR